MRVLITGLPYFTQKLYDDLREFDKVNTYYRLDTYYNKKDRLKAFFLIPRIDVVYSINGTLGKSRVFDMAFRFNKKVMMTWVGTDVTKARKLKSINQRYLNKAHHYCEVKWIQEELKLVKVDAKILNFFNFKEKLESTMPDTKELKILSYISKNREEYYGWKEIIAIAEERPEVQFTIVGTDGVGNFPDNVKCLGWVDSMPELFSEHHCTIRFVEHDGLSAFVLESLYRGKQVIYSEPLEHCLHARTEDEIRTAIDQLQLRLKNGESIINFSGQHYVDREFNRDKILSSVVSEMAK